LLRILFVLLSAVSFGGCSASFPSNSQSVSSSSVGGLSSQDAQSLAQFMASNEGVGVDNATQSNIFVAAAPSASASSTAAAGSAPAPVGGLSAISNCVSIQVISNVSTDQDIKFTFNCVTTTGTIEIKDTSTSGAQDEIITNLQNSGANEKNSVDSDALFSKAADGSTQITNQFDNTMTDGANSFEIKGSSDVSFVPDNSAQPQAGGKVSIASSVDSTKNGVDVGLLAVTSSNLHRSSCGFDSGSIELKGDNHDVVIVYSGCGNESVTDNGQPISVGPSSQPSATASASSSPSPSHSVTPSPSPSASPSASAVTFQSLEANIFTPICIVCHSGSGAPLGLTFDTYAGVMKAVNVASPTSSLIYVETKSGAMPEGGPALTSQQVSNILSWIQAGALNN
jgi:hypothetical protein